MKWLLAFLIGLPLIVYALSGRDAREGMVLLPGGVYERGCPECGMPDALPVHAVEIKEFWIDRTPVTNGDFERFQIATAYRTLAEKPPPAAEDPEINKSELAPGSAVFQAPTAGTMALAFPHSWWRYVPGAYWRQPEGPGSDIANRLDHPVDHIAYEDAEAYCHWRGKRLPTEAEFEYAARGGLPLKKYAWGDDPKPREKWPANLWQGEFPRENSGEDGYVGTSPVRAFAPNGYGLYDMVGNVWQWTSDWYRSDTYGGLAVQTTPAFNPRGPVDSWDPADPGVKKRVVRGCSFLCGGKDSFRYLVGARGKSVMGSTSSDTGFRCAKDQ